MKAIANPVEVEFAVITSVGGVGTSRIDVALDWGEGHARSDRVTLDPSMIARYVPHIGDYFVRQADGYEYLNPKAVFERKYHKADGGAWK